MPNEYYVTKNGVPCFLERNHRLARGGLLRACENGEPPHVFGVNYPSKLKAERAIKRTLRVSEMMRKSILSDWPKIQWLINAGKLRIEKRRV